MTLENACSLFYSVAVCLVFFIGLCFGAWFWWETLKGFL